MRYKLAVGIDLGLRNFIQSPFPLKYQEHFTSLPMPSVVVNEEKGTFLSYADSGVPGNSTDYTTVFLIQGYLWHAGTYAYVCYF